MVNAKQLQALVSGFSIETTPATAVRVGSFEALLPAGTKVNVTFLPGTGYLDTVATAARLRKEGMVPVPHIAARSIADASALESYLKRLQSEAAVDEALIIGGGVSKPVGSFHSSVQLLHTGLFDKYGIRRIGIAGHPEGTPDIPPSEVEQALQQKKAYAEATGTEMYLVTQFCFEAAPVVRWTEWLHSIGIHMPVSIGVPGPASIKTLLRFAQECGIGPSMRVITRQAKNVAKLLTIQTPDALLVALAQFQSIDAERQLQRIHLYPFGGFAKTCAWFSGVAEGNFMIGANGQGFASVETRPAAAS